MRQKRVAIVRLEVDEPFDFGCFLLVRADNFPAQILSVGSLLLQDKGAIIEVLFKYCVLFLPRELGCVFVPHKLRFKC